MYHSPQGYSTSFSPQQVTQSSSPAMRSARATCPPCDQPVRPTPGSYDPRQQVPYLPTTKAGFTVHAQASPMRPSTQNPYNSGFVSQAQTRSMRPSTQDVIGTSPQGATGGQFPSTYSPGSEQSPAQLCFTNRCSAPCSPHSQSPQSATGPYSGSNLTYSKTPDASLSVPENAANLTYTQSSPSSRSLEEMCASYNCSASCSPLRSPTSPMSSPDYTSTPAPRQCPPCCTDSSSKSYGTPRSQCSPCCYSDESYDSSFDATEDSSAADAFNYVMNAEHNVIKKFQPTPKAFENLQRRQGGFQPEFLSTPTADFGKEKICSPCTPSGYAHTAYGPSYVESQLWEEPPDVGTEKAQWCFNTTDYDNPFERH